MKQVCIIIIASIFIIACNSSIKINEEKAIELISNFLKRNLNDPESYQSIEYGTIDSLKSVIYYTDVFQHFDKYSKDESKNIQMHQNWRRTLQSCYLKLPFFVTLLS